MSETPTRPDELRTLEEKRRATGLSPVEEARRTELASAADTPRPGGFDVHAAAASVRAAVAAEPPRPEATAAWDLGAPAAVVSQALPGDGDAGFVVGYPESAPAQDTPAEPMTVDVDDIVPDLVAEPVRPVAEGEEPAGERPPGSPPVVAGAPWGPGASADALELASPLLVAAAPEPSGPIGPAPELGEPVDLATLSAGPALELPGTPVTELEQVLPDQPRAASPAPPPLAAEQATRRAGKLRVVLHTADGQVRRGFLSEFTPDAPELWLADVDGGPARPVAAGATRAIFLMLAPGEQRPPRRGRPVSLTFRDGRTLSGVSDDYHPEAPGFFVVPCGAGTRTARVWVYRRALRRVDVGEPDP